MTLTWKIRAGNAWINDMAWPHCTMLPMANRGKIARDGWSPLTNVHGQEYLVMISMSLLSFCWVSSPGYQTVFQSCAYVVLTFGAYLPWTATNGLEGEIPNEILTLVGLRELDVFANTIRGTIPEGFSALVNLRVLDLQENLLTGPAFPSSILDLRRLQSYRINSNSLTGPIPTRIGSLRALQELWAADNEITGTLPTEIGNLRDLKTILLYQNSIQGSLPSELGLIPLEGLWMWENFFQDTIPSQIFNLASLRVSSETMKSIGGCRTVSSHSLFLPIDIPIGK